MKYIKLEEISLNFIKYKNKNNTLKENFLKYILNFGKNYYENENFNVLNGVSFDLVSGDRLCIIGKNGAGKSSLLRILVGIYKPSSGTIKINGSVTSLLEVGAGMNPELTGRENILLSSLISGLPRKVIDLKMNEIIRFADIGDFIDVPMKYYSSGMCYRLSFSTALLVKPDILVVDELFAGGDINFINKASDQIEKLKNSASIFISVTHDMSYAKNFFNKILYLKDNQVEYFGNDIDYGVDLHIKSSII
jgi:ABC-type polysaccharide/polyol phosphate transport system ATPase subunit